MAPSRRTFLKLLIATLSTQGWAADPHDAEIRRGREFLAGLLDADLRLLPEFRGAKTYWLSHDNYLAAKVLARTHPQIAGTILAAIRGEGIGESDGKVELFVGEASQVLPFRHYELKEVRRVGDKVIRTEVAGDRAMTGWETYADLLFIASMAERALPAAREHWESAMRMWDGKGFADAAFKEQRIYATYKLALATLAAGKLSPRAEVPPALLHRLFALQSESGGWITDYDADAKAIGVANVETTSLAILALESVSETAPAKPL